MNNQFIKAKSFMQGVKNYWMFSSLFMGFVPLIFFILPQALNMFGNYLLLRQSDCSSENHISLTVGGKVLLTCDDKDVTWVSDNPNFNLQSSGLIWVDQDMTYPRGQARITAIKNNLGKVVCEFNKSVVPWSVNRNKFDVISITPQYSFMGLEFIPPHIFDKGRSIMLF